MIKEEKSPTVPRSLSDPPSYLFSSTDVPLSKLSDRGIKVSVSELKLKCSENVSIFTSNNAVIVSEYSVLRCSGKIWDTFIHNDNVSIIAYKSPSSSKYCVFAKGCVIGKGQEGTVYIGQDLTAKGIKMIAIKERICDNKKSRQLCLNEYKILEYLMRTKGMFANDTVHYIFMNYFPGVNASTLPRMWSDVLKQAVACGMLRALQSVHNAGILHGDVKPDNFIVEYQMGWIAVKLIDFGQSIFMNCSSNKLSGAPVYQPPECLLSIPPIKSRKTEFYSLAMCQVETLSTQSFQEYQAKKSRFDPYNHDDLIECCHDVFLNNKELSSMKMSNLWRYELLRIIYRMYVSDIAERADEIEVSMAIELIDQLETVCAKKASKDFEGSGILAVRKKRAIQKLDLKEIYRFSLLKGSSDESKSSSAPSSPSSPSDDLTRSSSSGIHVGQYSPKGCDSPKGASPRDKDSYAKG